MSPPHTPAAGAARLCGGRRGHGPLCDRAQDLLPVLRDPLDGALELGDAARGLDHARVLQRERGDSVSTRARGFNWRE